MEGRSIRRLLQLCTQEMMVACEVEEGEVFGAGRGGAHGREMRLQLVGELGSREDISKWKKSSMCVCSWE